MIKDVCDNFVLNVIKNYRLARTSKFPDKKISRGRSHSISSSVEDLFANFLIKNIGCDKILIDQPLSIEGVKKIIYPDITVIKNGHIVGFFDLKMDMGWNRDGLFELCKNNFDLVTLIGGRNCKLKNGEDKKISNFSINKECFYNIVIVNDGNIKSGKLENQIDGISKFISRVNVFILTSGKHLNTYNITANELMKEIKVRYDSFNKILKLF